jgi:hypothetical protein
MNLQRYEKGVEAKIEKFLDLPLHFEFALQKNLLLKQAASC